MNKPKPLTLKEAQDFVTKSGQFFELDRSVSIIDFVETLAHKRIGQKVFVLILR